MSRQSPFPSNNPRRRPNSPSQTNGYESSPTPFPNTVRPLKISRPTRPETPSNNSLSSPRVPSFASANGPSRPQRSDLRSRQISQYSNDDRASSSSRPTYDRESVHTMASDTSQVGNNYRARNGSSSTVSTRATQKSRGDAPAHKSPISPSSMAAVMAFQNAGRRRAQTIEDSEHERERKTQREKEQLMQQRIKEKAPGRRTNGKARAGDIDGMY